MAITQQQQSQLKKMAGEIQQKQTALIAAQTDVTNAVARFNDFVDKLGTPQWEAAEPYEQVTGG